jgi:hypothetical protein
VKGGECMGMTDRQFDVHLRSTLRDLEDVRDEINKVGKVKSDKLERMIKDIEDQLKRP